MGYSKTAGQQSPNAFAMIAEIQDVAFQSEQQPNGLAIWHVPNGKHAWLEWQVGVIETEFRHHPPRNNMPDGFRGSVLLFRLLGYGYTQEEALMMAQNRGKRYASG